jgi:hypothetical protein
MKSAYLALSACLVAFGAEGCSSVIEGTSQEILVNTNPSGADWSFSARVTSLLGLFRLLAALRSKRPSMTSP